MHYTSVWKRQDSTSVIHLLCTKCQKENKSLLPRYMFITVKIQSVGNYPTLILLLKRDAKSVQ